VGLGVPEESEVKKFVLLLVSAFFITCSSENPPMGEAGRRGGGFQPQPDETEKALSVKGSHVSREAISLYIVANTTLESVRDVTVYSKLNAIIAELSAEEGDTVRKGQPLARLDDREIKNEFEQARIALDQAKVSLKEAEVRAELSAASYERALTLRDQELISQQDFDQTVLSSRTDALAADRAKQQLVAAEARLDGARIQLDYTTIESPLDGVLTQRLVDVGDRVNVNEALFTVQEFPPLWARIYIPEKSLPELNLGQLAAIDVETYPEMRFEGRIKMISPTIDASSGTVKVTIEVARPGQYLRPGMFGTVRIATQTHPDAVVIPKKAIVRERDLNFVYLINSDGTVSRREIEIGFSEEDRVEILTGLQEGDAIVTVGHETLNDGYRVAVRSWEGTVPDSFETPAEPPRPQPAQVAESRGGRGAFFERLIANPDIKKQYEARLAEDPALATDPQKRRAFVREVMPQFRQSQGVQ